MKIDLLKHFVHYYSYLTLNKIADKYLRFHLDKKKPLRKNIINLKYHLRELIYLITVLCSMKHWAWTLVKNVSCAKRICSKSLLSFILTIISIYCVSSTSAYQMKLILKLDSTEISQLINLLVNKTVSYQLETSYGF